MKIIINKIKVLSDKENTNIKGGGKNRSDRRNGYCGYSRAMGHTKDENGHHTGCNIHFEATNLSSK